MDAWNRADVPAIVAMLSEDASFSMPPLPTWFRGKDAIAAFLNARIFRTTWSFELTSASGQPAMVGRRPNPDSGRDELAALTVFAFDGELVSEITAFLGAGVLERFRPGESCAPPMSSALRPLSIDRRGPYRRRAQMLQDKTALIHGGGGAIGGAVARAFAAAGARVYLAGRTRARLEAVASDIGAADVAEVDVLDERAVAAHADAVAAEAGGIDIALNAASFPYVSAPLSELTVEQVMHPIDSFLRANLNTAKAVAPHMTAGTILTLSTVGSRFARPGNLGFGTACAAIEQMSQRLAAELGPSGVRVVCLRPHAIPDAASNGSFTGEVFAPLAAAAGVSVEQLLARWGEDQALLGRLPTLAQLADTAVFLASDRAGAITGSVVDLSCGSAIRAQQFGQALIGVLD